MSKSYDDERRHPDLPVRRGLAASALALIMWSGGGCGTSEHPTHAIEAERIGVARQAETLCGEPGVAPCTYEPPDLLSKPESDRLAIRHAIARAQKKYNLPRWFYYAVIQRESSFNRCAYRPDDYGRGLTQLTKLPHNGFPYPGGQEGVVQGNLVLLGHPLEKACSVHVIREHGVRELRRAA